MFLLHIYQLMFGIVSHFLWLICLATVRRLYDIANILISLRLIQKLSGVELKSRKALFTYIGPQSNDMRSMY